MSRPKPIAVIETGLLIELFIAYSPMDYVFDKWWSMNDKTAGLPHLKVVQRMLEVVMTTCVTGHISRVNLRYSLTVCKIPLAPLLDFHHELHSVT